MRDALLLGGAADGSVDTAQQSAVCDLTYGKELTGFDRIFAFLLRDATFYCDLISVFPLLIQPMPPAF